MAFATLASCGSGKPTAAPPTPSLPQQAPDPVERCGFAGQVEKLELTAADGVKLSGVRLGSGTHGVVLLPQAGADICGWSAAIPGLVEAGFHVLAIDLRCAGYSECDQPDNDDWQDGTPDFAARRGRRDRRAEAGRCHQGRDHGRHRSARPPRL